MSTSGEGQVSMETFRMLAELAGLGMSQEELGDLKPLYDIHAEYVKTLHSIDFGPEEIAMTFHPEWPSSE